MEKALIYAAKKLEKTKDTQYPLSRKILADLKQDLKFHKGRFLDGFHAFPQTYRFESQDVEEKIILLLRKHFITNIPWILIAVLLFILPTFFTDLRLLDFLPIRFKIITFILWYLMVLAYILEKFLSWVYNSYIVTDERIIDIDFYSLVYKRISEAKIDKIEDITYVQGGFIQSMFDFGTVTIQTAAEKREFEFEDVPKPAIVCKVINQLIIQEEQEVIEGRVR